MLTIDNYQQQANDFLINTQTTMSVARTLDNNCPQWCDENHEHGDEYKITFKRGRKSTSLQFWNSYKDKQKGKQPDAYNVLASISGDMYAKDMTFADFCSDYGYSDDSIKAKLMYSALVRQSINLNKIWSDSREIELLQEIQ